MRREGGAVAGDRVERIVSRATGPDHRLKRGVAIAVAALMVAVLAALDTVTGSEIAFSLFYLAPIALATWAAGTGVGMAFAIVGALLWGVSDAVGGARYSNEWILYWNAGMRFAFFVITLWLLGRLRDAQTRDRRMARTDSLTGVLNARAFYSELGREIERCRRTGDPFVLVYADLDHFKSVNDTLGHLAGDQVLKDVACAMRESLRSIDVVARIGGDEMAVLLPETDGAEADRVLGRLREAVCGAIRQTPGVSEDVGLTAGAVVFTLPPDSPEEAIREADVLMYEGKNTGRGRTLCKTA